MPIFRISIQCAINELTASYKWSNTWYVSRADRFEAASAAVGMASFYPQALWEDAFVYNVYVSDMIPNTTNYENIPIGTEGVGQITGLYGEPYHPFICTRVDLTVPGSRPSRKFWRTPLFEGMVSNGRLIAPEIAAAISAAMADMTTVSGLCDVDGEGITGHLVKGVTSRRLGRQAFFDVPLKPGGV